jgi:hypothetical protein
MGFTGAKYVGQKALAAKIRKMTSGAGKGQARIGTNLEYGPYVELGTSKQRAQAYLRPALDEKRGEALKEVANVLKMNLPGTMRVKAALHAGGLVVEVAAKQKAPVLTGTLRSSITTEATEG